MPSQKRPLKSFCISKSILWKTALHSMMLTTFTALVLSVSAYVIARELLEQRAFAQLSILATSKEELVELRLNVDRERTAILSRRSELRNAFGTRGEEKVVQELLAELQEEGAPVLGITSFSPDGAMREHFGLYVPPPSGLVDATVLVPLFDKEGWKGHAIHSPVKDGDGNVIGMVGMRFSMYELLHSILSASDIGKTGEVLLGIMRDGELVLLNHPYAENLRSPLSLGGFEEQLAFGSPMAEALVYNEGVRRAEDYAGRDVFAAYRSIAALGWGVVVQIGVAEAMRGVSFLKITLVSVSVLLLGMAAYIAFVLARQLTQPLMRLSAHMVRLGPGHWRFQRSVHTGDEVELLDRVVAEMADRLRNVYEHLEDEVEDRTAKLAAQYIKDRAIVETVDHGIILVDAKGRVTEVNPAAADMLQCKSTGCVSAQVDAILGIRLRQKLLKGAKHPVLQSIRTGKTVRSTPEKHFSIMRSDGIQIPVMLVSKPILQGKDFIGAVVIFQDITDERRVDYLKSEFISLASHQLRTPLSTVQWYIELLGGEGKLSRSQRDYLREMETAAKRMTKLIDSLLHAARLEGNDIKPHTQSVDIRALITDLGEELRSLAKEKNIACTIDIPRGEADLDTDSVLLHVVFKNLFSNAVKYTGKGGQVGVAMRRSPQSVEISVSDSGIGVPQKEQKRIFQRLFRATNVRKMDTDGNGLGLYISKMIIDALGGKISFKSKEGKGSTFTVTIPLKGRRKR